MKAMTVKRILKDLTDQCHGYHDAVHPIISGNGFTIYATVWETTWSVDIKDGLLTLEINNNTEFIDTDSITRITI